MKHTTRNVSDQAGNDRVESFSPFAIYDVRHGSRSFQTISGVLQRFVLESRLRRRDACLELFEKMSNCICLGDVFRHSFLERQASCVKGWRKFNSDKSVAFYSCLYWHLCRVIRRVSTHLFMHAPVPCFFLCRIPNLCCKAHRYMVRGFLSSVSHATQPTPAHGHQIFALHCFPTVACAYDRFCIGYVLYTRGVFKHPLMTALAADLVSFRLYAIKRCISWDSSLFSSNVPPLPCTKRSPRRALSNFILLNNHEYLISNYPCVHADFPLRKVLRFRPSVL